MASSPGRPYIQPGAVIFGPKANCTLDICSVQYSVYGYRPSLAANTSFIALFALAGLIHVYLGFRYKSWFFMGCMLIGCLSAVLGYVGRVMMYYNPFNFAAFMLQITCVTTTPVYYCAAIYVTLAKTIQSLCPGLSRFRPSIFYWLFIPCDLVSLVIQAAGGGLSTSSRGNSQQGVDLALAGLAFQVFTICAFCGFLADFMFRYLRSGQMGANKLAPRLKIYFGFLSLAIFLITLRCTYRLAELHKGYKGGLVRDEGLFIALEGVLVLASVYALVFAHPGPVFGIADEPQLRLESRGNEMANLQPVTSLK